MNRAAGTTVYLLAMIGISLGHTALAESVAVISLKDNTLFSTDGSTSNGAGNSMFSGRTGNLPPEPITLRAVLAFDVVGNIPVGSTITSASLVLELVQASQSGGNEIHTLHRILADWGEGTSNGPGGQGAPSTPGDATWLHTFFPDKFWADEGGDFDPTVSASQTVGVNPGLFTWNSTDQLVADVQGWLDNPQDNFGWMLRGNEAQLNTARKFSTRESCQADIDMNNIVNAADLAVLLGSWGACTECPADLNGNNAIDAGDLALLLGDWGLCGRPRLIIEFAAP